MTASFTWQDGPGGGTPLTASNFNRFALIADVGTSGTPTANALRATHAPRSRGPLTIALGDSVDQGADQQDYYSAGSIFSALCILSGQKVKWLRNSGIGGNTTADVLARVQADAIAYNPGVVIIGGGATNDHGQGITPATTRANLTAIRDALWKAGITVIARTAPPTDVAGTGGTNTVGLRRMAVQQHNAWLKAWAGAAGIPVLDYYAPLVNEITGGYIASYTSDGTHPNTAGILAVANAVIAAGLPSVFIGAPILAASVGDNADLLAGAGLFLGTPSGGVAGGWTHYGNDATPSITADTAVPGNWQKITGGTSSIHVVDSPVIVSGFSVGDTIEFAARVQKAGAADSGLKLRMFDANGNETGRLSPSDGTRAISGIAAARTTVPAGTTSMQVEATVTFGETFSFAQATVTNISGLNALTTWPVAPALVGSANLTTGGGASLTVSTQPGDLVLVFGITDDYNITVATPTGGTGITWTSVASVTGVAGRSAVYCWKGTATAAETATITTTVSAYANISAQVWRGSSGVGATAKVSAGSTAQATLTTGAAHSAIAVAIDDYNVTDGASRAYLTSAGTPTEVYYQKYGTFFTGYLAAYPDTGTAGSKTVGLTAPSGMQPTVVAVEILR